MDNQKNNTYNRENESLDLSILWKVFKRRWILIVLVGILVGLGVGAYSSLRYVPKYSASVSFLIHADEVVTSQFQNVNSNESIVHTYEVAFKYNREFCQELNQYAGTADELGYSAADVAAMMNCEQILPNTPTLKITFTCPNRVAAYNLAMAMLSLANGEIEGRFSNLSAVDIFNMPEEPLSPVTRDPFAQMFVVGFAGGALALYALFLLFALTDKVIHGEVSMEAFSEYPILGVVPTLSEKRGSGRQSRSGS